MIKPLAEIENVDDLGWREQRRLFVWLWRDYMRKHIVPVVVAALLMSIEGSMLGLMSYMMKPMFDDVFVGGNEEAMLIVGIVMMGIFVIRAFANVAQRVLITRTSAKIVFELQTRLLQHVMTLDTLFHQANPPGALMERIRGDTGAIRNVSNVLITGAGRDVMSLVSLLAVVFWIDWRWTLIALVGVPLLVLPSLLVQRFVRQVSLRNRINAGMMSTRLDEIFHGITPIKLNALEAYQTGRFRDLADQQIQTETRASFGKALIPAMIDIMSGIGFCAVLLYGGSEILAGEKTLGEFMSFFAAMALAFDPIRRIGGMSGVWQATAVSLHRLKTLLEMRPNLKSPEHPVRLPEAQGDIRLDGVELAYGDLPVLRGTTFTAHAGQTTALVGLSGAGKSTVFNVLTRLVEIDGGVVTMSGTDIRRFDIADLRGQFSVVTQDALLFDESVRENILLGRTDVSEERLREVIDAAFVSDFIDALSDGIDSPAGPRGSALSGGQRQRVAIARALLRDTPILLLDEATSALDAHSEAVVQSALERLSEGRTTLVIAHRLATVRNADKIVVMDAGRVVEQGTHAELLERDGAYAELYRLQFSERDEASAAE
ncbi:ABC transporter ATP-binding protein [Tropicimonas isoalkanivorans]|uniref:ATP-binding cassette, subfamily B, MsbA n=1 Tax=Tropicimonas isoalkanivorans TaxID=441112 RepID=A0A1I1FX82_9RHOB|nr:ABC transporter ATP-binding protein [Tropicimonas isoalkanivorans]SFC03656.1 ATP-binding cassette, subfamily B, MsbA [Tropicimonas isoalkanivorans]